MTEAASRKQKRAAIVTGGFAGIGLSAATELARQGVSVALGARTVVDASLRQLDEIGPPVWGGVLDVRDTESVRAFVSEAEQQLGPVDILVNSAGIGTQQTVSEHDEEKWLDVIDTNLNGCFRMVKACMPGMMARKWGRIVSVGSTAARTAVSGHAAYCASKSGLLGLNRAVALEGAAHGITATVVSPTWVQTDMLNRSFQAKAKEQGTSYEQEIAALISQSPQQRLVQPGEIGALIAFLCRDAAAGITMEDIQVNAAAWW
ncbi:MAG TPA: 3-oxoacyl-ACP reductase [Gammaproteobacteria bacterium]|jgi:NAD(P)-dependent dehydrogenase (short-subunit alcohol dehydrogenase family)|nr:3-oxoacyl-ACP reductase [Acidiferrobacteraceae bacterium]MDP6398231.1 SDR family oxidoreductase [Arenicellales bacterium]HCX87104.1 3-oxoacyl-ACP reductase [Gammaproteobacteria bacterium]MDP6552068.1 SDR family oxidoreductase [Arenicellales bacterium]MDP6791580.1 SDR family oxidoreductase [Arenicellales bacterium]|tara:strand:- start:261 stop:1043 length:783 start_codon:yes stop_codon:yes gene_type:complete